MSLMTAGLGCSDDPAPTARIGTVQQAAVGPNVEIGTHDGLPVIAAIEEIQTEQSVVETSIAGEPALLAAYMDYTSQVDRGSAPATLVPNYSLMGYSISLDDGATWTRQPQLTLPSIPNELQEGGIGHRPAIATDETGRNVYYVSLGRNAEGRNCGFAFARSSDGGSSWDAPQYIDTTNHCDYAITDLSIAAGHGRVHVATTIDGGFGIWVVLVLRSTDGGDSWDSPFPGFEAPGFPRNPIVRVNPLAAGEVYLSFEVNRDGAISDIYFARSAAQGVSDSFDILSVPAQNVVPTDLVPPDNRNFFSSFIVNRGNGHCEIAYEDQGQIRFIDSLDGEEWQQVPLPDDLEIIRYKPMIADNPPNHIAIMYYGQLEEGTYYDTHVYAMISVDNGQSLNGWLGPKQITESSAEGSVPFAPPCTTSERFFGSHPGLVGLGGEAPDMFYGAWSDSRRGAVQCDTFADPFTAKHQHSMGTWFTPEHQP